MHIATEVNDCIEGLRTTGEPHVWTAGTERNANIVLNYSLSKPEIDGGGTDLWETVKPLMIADLECLVENGHTETDCVILGSLEQEHGAITDLSISAASVRVELNEENDAYDYIFWLEVFVEFEVTE